MRLQPREGNNFAGFVMQNEKKGEQVKVLTRAMCTSDDPFFYSYCDSIASIFLTQVGVLINSIHQFLVVIHSDTSSDVYINDFVVLSEIKAKRDIGAGEKIFQNDIADMGKIKFPEIPITETYKVIYCFKVGWRFGLFFDVAQRVAIGATVEVHKLDLEQMAISIGTLNRYLTFYNLYKTIETGPNFEEMLRDGWFPFIEILGDVYNQISLKYANKHDFENQIELTLNLFNAERINKITTKWWQQPIFAQKKSLIEVGVNSYLENTPNGFISSISVLFPQIEGILRKLYMLDTGRGDKSVQVKDIISHIIDKGITNATAPESLFLPTYFLHYLQDVIFAGFDLSSGNVKLSRHSSGHGVANAHDYTKTRALQLILVLDQFFFYSK